jgi:hypothetical protein
MRRQWCVFRKPLPSNDQTNWSLDRSAGLGGCRDEILSAGSSLSRGRDRDNLTGSLVTGERYRFKNSAGVCPANAAYFERAAAFSGVSSIFIGRGVAPIINTWAMGSRDGNRLQTSRNFQQSSLADFRAHPHAIKAVVDSLDVIFLLDLPKLGRTCAQSLIYSKLQNPIERNCRRRPSWRQIQNR